jgi:hypothetical protein
VWLGALCFSVGLLGPQLCKFGQEMIFLQMVKHVLTFSSHGHGASTLNSQLVNQRYNFFPLVLFKLYMLGWLLGGIYSVPPIRTKRNPIAAGLTIATVRGFLLNFGVYYAVKDAIGAPFAWSSKVSFIARFMTIFATVIAVTKDLPDVEGDKVRICRNVLTLIYLVSYDS